MPFYLDTGPLFDYLLLRTIAKMRGAESIVDLEYHVAVKERVVCLKDRIARRAFERFVSAPEYRPLRTVPGVWSESNGILRRLLKRARNSPVGFELSGFWLSAREECDSLGIVEESADLRVMEHDLVARLGAVDAALLHLAGGMSDGAIVTADGNLRDACGARGIRCLRVFELIELFT